MSNVTTTTSAVEKSEETFHIYILSFSYGFLLIIILGHMIIRWQWRRVKVSQFPSHYPGDKSFKCKAIRQRLISDFATISGLSPDPTLINENFGPETFGACKDTSPRPVLEYVFGVGWRTVSDVCWRAVPSHWYRMKTCEAADAFVSLNENILKSTTTSIPLEEQAPLSASDISRGRRIEAFPDFVSKLRTVKSFGELEKELLNRACDLYTKARFKDGEFPEALFEEFGQILHRLQDTLDPDKAHPGLQSVASITSSIQFQYDSSQLGVKRMSLEPLLASNKNESSLEAPELKLTSTMTSTTPSHTKSRKNDAYEISPLILLVQPPSYPSESTFSIPETPV